ncbi:MAG TPA: hypothetical protein V6D19_16035 [Stenomitos sp.]
MGRAATGQSSLNFASEEKRSPLGIRWGLLREKPCTTPLLEQPPAEPDSLAHLGSTRAFAAYPRFAAVFHVPCLGSTFCTQKAEETTKMAQKA